MVISSLELTLTDVKYEVTVSRRMVQQLVAGLVTEGRHVHDGTWIGGDDFKHFAGIYGCNGLAGAEYGEWAVQSPSIYGM